MGRMKIWYDEEGDFLEIGFGERKGFFKDIGNDIWERIENGTIKGVAVLNFRKRTSKENAIDLPIDISLEPTESEVQA
jgi:hypothetical protein